MPPAKPTTHRTTRRRTRAMAPESLVGNPLEGRPAPARAVRPSFSPYPDLSMAIEMLARRKSHVQGERLVLVTRWLETLEKMQAEMQKLHKLENLASRLTSS